MEKKFELTVKSKIVDDVKVYRIKALKSFGDVNKGDFGGYVENESNLSQSGNCWLYENAAVLGNAKVYDNARAYMNSKIRDNAKIYGNAIVTNRVEIRGNAKVYDNATVCGNSEIVDNSEVYGYAVLGDTVKVNKDAKVYGEAIIYGNSRITDNARVCGGWIKDLIDGDGLIEGNKDYIKISDSCNDYVFFKNSNKQIVYRTNLGRGTIEEFEERNKYSESKIRIAKVVREYFEVAAR